MAVQYQGLIALDIDGTITIERHTLDPKVSNFLNRLISEGWELIFITGRTFSFALPVLSTIRGKYYLAVQNGAALFQMPQKELIKSHTISTAHLPALEKIFENEVGGLLVESGRACNDFCYYKPSDFTEEELDYIHFRIELSPEEWVAVDSFDGLPFDTFFVGKYFATEKKAYEIRERILAIPKTSFNVVVIRDPFRPGEYLAHVNDGNASKGAVLGDVMHPVIAAGDDYNDLEMLERATIKIVMQNAPEELHKHADILAQPAAEHGIIVALEEAIKKWKD